MCGIIGLIENKPVVERLYRGLLTLQHRGQDAAGMLTYNGIFHSRKGAGLIKDVFRSYEDIIHLKGNVGLAQVRYPTIGSGKAEDAQPFIVNYPYGIAIVHNGNVPNYKQVRDIIENKHKRMLYSKNDVEAILNIFAEALSKNVKRKLEFKDIIKAVKAVYKTVVGAYSVLLYIKGEGFVAFKDPYGIRPLVIGCKKDEFLPQFAFASESAAITTLGYKEFRDVESGEVIFIDEKKRKMYSEIIVNHKKVPHTPCIFEWVYFARPDSVIDKVNVYKSRVHMGRYLANEVKKRELDIDVVIPVPDSARDAAIEIARVLNLKYREGLVKNRYIGRTFIMPGEKTRSISVQQKLSPIFSEIKDKRVLLVDDSIVRGNTSRNIIKMVKEAGAEKVYFASYSAPLTSPCFYGIDMQTRNEFAARGRDEKEIAKLIGSDEVIYQSIEMMQKAIKDGNPELKQFCDACFTGIYPTKEIDLKIIEEIEEERNSFAPKN
jgi:amidophosphoribosyltransferase